MAWYLQTPEGASPKLLKQILAECGTANKAGGAFAFASAQGVKLLAAEPAFEAFLKSSECTVVVGLDAITDTRAIEQLQKIKTSHPNFKPKLFLHKTAGSIFHPKTMWLKTDTGGVVITGSGNLTSGGLLSNWEAMAVEKLTVLEFSQLENAWDAWLKAHAKQLFELDDEKALERAKANKILRSKIKKALKKSDEEEEQAEADAVEEIEHELFLNPVLIAEVPKSGDRWQQVNFDLKSYQEYFGVTKGATKHLRFYEVRDDGSLGAPEDRQSVSVKSQNYRFEIGAAAGKPYPSKGNPILVFQKTQEDVFQYVLLMPGASAHKLIQEYLDNSFERTSKKLRVIVTLGTVQKAWPECPFFK